MNSESAGGVRLQAEPETDWTADQRQALQAYARDNKLWLELDVTDDRRTAFAGFSMGENNYPSYTVLWTGRRYLLTDRLGYTVCQASTLPAALDVLSVQLQVEHV